MNQQGLNIQSSPDWCCGTSVQLFFFFPSRRSRVWMAYRKRRQHLPFELLLKPKSWNKFVASGLKVHISFHHKASFFWFVAKTNQRSVKSMFSINHEKLKFTTVSWRLRRVLKSLSKDKLELEAEHQKAKTNKNQVWRVKEALTFCNLNCAFDCIFRISADDPSVQFLSAAYPAPSQRSLGSKSPVYHRADV